MRLTIGKKLGLGFFAVLALMAISAAIVFASVGNMNRAIQTVANCDQMLNGLNHSIAALRGYVILGDAAQQAEFFTSERLSAWENIDAGMSGILADSADFRDAGISETIERVKRDLPRLRESQDQVEKLAHTPDNIPAVRILLEDASPEAETILNAITIMIDAEATNEASAERKALLKNLADLRGSLAQSVSDMRAYLLAGEASFRDEFDTHWAQNQSAYAALEAQSPLFLGPQLASWRELQESRDAFSPLPRKMFASRAGEDWNRALHIMETKSAPQGGAQRKDLEELKTIAGSDLHAARRMVTVTLIAATLMAVAIGALIAVLLSRSMANSIQQVLSCVQSVANGDLTGHEVRIDSRDELGALSQGVNAMVQSLRGILSAANRTTSEVAAASSEIATGAQQQLATLNQTATSLNEITTTSEEFKATMQEFADRARAVQEAADETTERTADGRRLTQKSAAKISQVRDNSLTAGKSVLKLAEQMQRIGEITATVNELAEQTKLLALNASIEAARAGDEGRGFAVVATQVRELANQSKESAGRIEGLISSTQKSMQEVVAKIHDGSRLAEDSAESVEQMAQTFEEIAQAIEQTREAMSQMHTGARQQEQGLVELVSSIAEIDTSSRETVAAAEQTQKAIVAIDQRIQSLNANIARFKT